MSSEQLLEAYRETRVKSSARLDIRIRRGKFPYGSVMTGKTVGLRDPMGGK